MGRVSSDINDYVKSLVENPTFKSDVAEIEKALPTSIVEEAKTNPEAIIHDIATKSSIPAYIDAIPTKAIDSLECLAAPPLKAVNDLERYVSSVIEEPSMKPAIAVLATAVPSNVQHHLQSDPASALKDLITATGTKDWIAAIPTSVQSQLESVINKGLKIFASDLEATASASCSPTSTKSVRYPKATASNGHFMGYIASPTAAASCSGTGVGGARKPTGSPIAFEGSASSFHNSAFGFAALAAGVIVWCNI